MTAHSTVNPDSNQPRAEHEPGLDSDPDRSADSGDTASETGFDETAFSPEAVEADELARMREQLAYLTADFENFKRQSARRLEEERQRAARRVLEEMLPALDNFELARRYATDSSDVASLRTGLDFVAQQMESAFKNAGLEPVDALGHSFDPQLHEAIEEVESDEPSGTVVDQVQRGFRFAGQLLRPARVKVAR